MSGNSAELTCLLCFGNRNDDFVKSKNGHYFHYACVRYMTDDVGYAMCPACDENLATQKLALVEESDSAPAPAPTPGPKPTQTARSEQLNTDWRNEANAVEEFFESLSLTRRSGNGPASQRSSTLNPNSQDRGTGSGRGAISNGVGSSAATISTASASRTQPDYAFKICIVGNYGVGKSALLRRFSDESYGENLIPTVGCDVRFKAIDLGGKRIQLKLWDTAGQERFRNSLVASYLRNSDGIILCYDVSDLQSLQSINEWHTFCLEHGPARAMKIMVGLKSDLWYTSKREVESEDIAAVANHLNLENIWCSAKDAQNVEAVFRSVASEILEDKMDREMQSLTASPAATFQLHEKEKKKKKKKKCCDV